MNKKLLHPLAFTLLLSAFTSSQAMRIVEPVAEAVKETAEIPAEIINPDNNDNNDDDLDIIDEEDDEEETGEILPLGPTEESTDDEDDEDEADILPYEEDDEDVILPYEEESAICPYCS